MTVIPSSLSNSPTCTVSWSTVPLITVSSLTAYQNLTYPRLDQALAVTALDTTGPASQYGWPSQVSEADNR